MIQTARSFTILATLLLGAAHGAILDGPIINPQNGHIYYLLTSQNWTASQAEAITLGGNLVTINDAAENTWVYNTFTSNGSINRNLWIGLNDAAAEGSFIWADGSPFSFTNWRSGEPNDAGGIEDYVFVHGPAEPYQTFWNDFSNTSDYSGQPLNGVVETVPEPASAVLLLFGVALSFRRRALRTNERNG